MIQVSTLFIWKKNDHIVHSCVSNVITERRDYSVNCQLIPRFTQCSEMQFNKHFEHNETENHQFTLSNSFAAYTNTWQLNTNVSDMHHLSPWKYLFWWWINGVFLSFFLNKLSKLHTTQWWRTDNVTIWLNRMLFWIDSAVMATITDTRHQGAINNIPQQF
jgi:hypothetical protein